MFLISHNYEVFLKLIWKYLQLLVSVILNIPRIRFFEFITYCNVIFLYYWLPVLYKIKRITFKKKKNIYIYKYIYIYISDRLSYTTYSYRNRAIYKCVITLVQYILLHGQYKSNIPFE